MRLLPQQIHNRWFSISSALFFAAAHCSHSYGSDLQVVWTATEPSQSLKTLTGDDLRHLKKSASTEVDPQSGKAVRWDGVLLGDLIESVLKDFPNEKKAQIDLVVLKNTAGAEALIPRSFIVKYPFLLALQKDHKALEAPQGVPPWTSKSKSKTEGLPLETFFVSQVSEIDLANYRERYGTVFLKNRMEPTALRGEKTFIQNCLSCHNGNQGSAGIAEARKEMNDHPVVKGAPKLDDRDRRALKTYLEIYQTENPTTAAPPSAVGKATSASSH